ncbi:hypothetical protein JM946_18675 [Steroidobacter sp. S1-65]|uniref:Uncharacterized protein n=1 Tax=Steroidobacter gossypii TaxID=2805490 RepID=A0ABS1X0L4_9GAMM|nr:hypothetical protein [Steroidobacter gossypii]MBM0106762.1 hypothetical protein [Steroidobacter gossypii]
MDDFSSKAGLLNMFGLIQSDAHLVGPNQRRSSASDGRNERDKAVGY